MGENIRLRHEGAEVKLIFLDPGVYALSGLWSLSRGKGHAKELLKKVEEIADSENLTIRLVVQAYGLPVQEALSNDQLEALYSRFGFTRVEGSRPPHMMIRHPSQEIHAP